MSDQATAFGKMLEELALETVTLDSDDVQGMGRILNIVCAMEDGCSDWENKPLHSVLRAVKDYIEQLVLNQTDEVAPLEESIKCLQSIFRAVQTGESFKMDISKVLRRLGSDGDRSADEIRGSEPPSAPDMAETGGAENSASAGISNDESQILVEFAIESLENLESIEVNLIQLEENPDDLEIIDAIFRPFHTIKGVSGFLNLMDINQLAHSVESLLDKSRSGEIAINEDIVDIVLESVDLLTGLLLEVKSSSAMNLSPKLESFDSTDLVGRIENLKSKFDAIGNKSLGEILAEKEEINQEAVKNGLIDQQKDPDKRIGEILLEEKVAKSKEIISALRDQRRFGKRDSELNIKVDTNKLDTLVDMTGELVIAHAILRRHIQTISEKDQTLHKNLNQILQITSTLQKTTMSLRMIPIKSTFRKMVRLVRELSRVSGKAVDLKMKGAGTEIDRTMVDELYEPMVHMIRNAIDHGIEDPERREKAGKSARGTVELRASHRGGNLVIEIEDDGCGLDKNRILEKAVSRNLVDNENNLSESEIYDFIFHPGFSTAREVTDISGRGVGMDVVKRAIEKLQGRIEILSTPGSGTTFIIRLPLTLAIMDGVLVHVGTQRYIIPTLSILETFAPREDQYFTIQGKGEMIKYRDDLVPLVRLDRIFGEERRNTNPWDALVVAITHDGKKRYLMIDEIIGKEEVVIKSLGEHLKNTKGVAGCTIMGDGRVGLILDIPDLIDISLTCDAL